MILCNTNKSIHKSAVGNHSFLRRWLKLLLLQVCQLIDKFQDEVLLATHGIVLMKQVQTQVGFSQLSYISTAGFAASIKPEHCESATVIF